MENTDLNNLLQFYPEGGYSSERDITFEKAREIQLKKGNIYVCRGKSPNGDILVIPGFKKSYDRVQPIRVPQDEAEALSELEKFFEGKIELKKNFFENSLYLRTPTSKEKIVFW